MSVLRRGFVAAFSLVVAVGLLWATPAAAQPDGSLGKVTDFSADGATYTLTAGPAKVRVIFQRDDVFRLWLAPDGQFTDPANTPPPDPNAPSSNIVVKTDYPAPSTQWTDKGTYFSLRTNTIEVRAYKDPLRFALHRADGSVIWSETKALSWTDKTATQSLGRGVAEQFVGGGMQNGRFSHRDKTIKVTRDFNWADGGNPNASPYYMSTAGYGVLRNTFAPGNYAFTEPVATTHEEKRFDAYYFAGDMYTALDRYTELTGRPFLPPLYGMEYGDSDCYNRGHYRPGVDPDPNNDWKYHQDKETTAADAPKIAQKFADHDMPRGWMLVNDDYGCGYSADRDAFVPNPNPGGVERYIGTRDIEALTKAGDELRKRGVHMGLWTEAALDKQPEEVGKAGVRVRKLDVAWVGPGYRHALSACDTAHGGIEQHSDARGYSWMVEGWAGAQRCAVQWTGDHSGTLDNIKWQIPAIHGSGNSAIAYAAGDIDGIFGGSATSYVRDMQWKVFNPALMTMSGWSTPKFKQPWAYGEPYTAINRKYLKLRERLLPYLYSYAANAHRTGAPINRSLVLEYPDDPKTWDDTTKYEFLAGKEFLVAPMWTDSEVKDGIYLPAGTWIDYWTGKLYQGQTTVNGYHAPLDRLPLFVKAGAVVPMWRDGINGHAEQKPGDRVTVDVYPQGNSSFDLYEDDRTTRAHREGKSATQRFDVTAPVAGKGDVTVHIGQSVGEYAGKPSARPYELTVHTGSKPKVVKADDRPLTEHPSKQAYEAAETGWYYAETDRGGVVNVKTSPVATSASSVITLAGASSVGGGAHASDSLGVPELSTPDLWAAPGQPTDVTATFRNGGTHRMLDVRMALNLPQGWTAVPRDPAPARVVEPGRTVSARFTVTPGATVPPGKYTVRADVTYTARAGRVYYNTAVAGAALPYASMSTAANTVGVTDATTFAKGGFDPDGNSFAGELLADKGFRPGAKVTVNGAEFTLPPGAPGSPNLVKNNAQPILVSGTGTHLAFLASGASTNATGTVTAMYTDGTESQHALQVPNWSFQDEGTGGSKLAVAVKGRYTPTGLANTDVDYRMFYNTVELVPGKQIRAVKLPANSTIGFFAAAVHDRPLPPAPKGEAFVSDLEWISTTNGWGPVERDKSNNESAGGDGNPLTLNGVTYAKGLGGHAVSAVKANLGGVCTRFTAKVGVDDEMADRGSVVFRVVVDGVEKYVSPVLTGNSATATVDVDVTGGKTMDLHIGDGGNGVGSDHGDWAEAKLTCAP
ncbi:alpha-glucosidase (family GH31 glycosyl hydrolase) [Herbihabitans rhizosphaerae]|uniref:Alpha-glucosidase (Family GH31 glycosyl hydrolase) n=1 Tax=Herbihabitans rhizosphaerae TaxID=1872711 RepID=A0A4Q7KDI6_9PSEU|nr:NPCBM/NEW2 domain-containing protein [Herbihabitans rhizosphaerae]RZS31206.1 alpha-glucosidase (family GH31 glycosyl hydrolase) [Herbihabitans rhizosphaerae]